MEGNEKNLWIGGAVAAGLVWFLFFRNTEYGGNGIDPTGNGSNGNTGNGNYFDAHKVAIDLYDAMKESGTDEEAVVYILTPINQAQFNLVFDAFGKLKYNPALGNQWSLWGDLDRYDLKGWLKSELSPTEYANLKRKYPNKL